MISIALNSNALYTGSIDSITGYAITLDSADFSVSDLTTYPHFLRIKADGNNQGQVYLIVSHTTTGSSDSVTVNTSPSALSANDEVTIIPAHTLASLFGCNPTSIGSISVSGSDVTINTGSNHGLNTGDQVTLASISGSPSLSGDFDITRTGSNQFHNRRF